MIKIRLEYVDNPKGQWELERLIDALEEKYTVLSRSKPYINRNSLYKRIYVEVEEEWIKGDGKHGCNQKRFILQNL